MIAEVIQLKVVEINIMRNMKIELCKITLFIIVVKTNKGKEINL